MNNNGVLFCCLTVSIYRVCWFTESLLVVSGFKEFLWKLSECWNTFLTAELYWQIEGLTGSWKKKTLMLPRRFIQWKLWLQTPGLQGKLCIGQWLWWKHALTAAGKCFCLSCCFEPGAVIYHLLVKLNPLYLDTCQHSLFWADKIIWAAWEAC